MEFEQLPGIAAYEEIANVSAIEPQTQIFTEMNCSERMTRRLSTSIHAKRPESFSKQAERMGVRAARGQRCDVAENLVPKTMTVSI